MRHWTKAVVCGAVSTAIIVIIQITPTPEPGFAGAAFGYNVTFFFPLVLLSFAFWVVAVVFYVLFIRCAPTAQHYDSSCPLCSSSRAHTSWPSYASASISSLIFHHCRLDAQIAWNVNHLTRRWS
jgi:uncharacterized membrane protein